MQLRSVPNEVVSPELAKKALGKDGNEDFGNRFERVGGDAAR
jgi:hypothetical protein